MKQKTTVKNYLVSLVDTKTGDVILKTFVQGYWRKQGHFMLQDLYEKYSPNYQKKAYAHTIELKETNRMKYDLERLIARYGNKVSPAELHFHVGKDDAVYVCYPPQLASWEEAEAVLEKFCLATYFQIRTRVDPNYFESFGCFLLNREEVEVKKSFSVFDQVSRWISDYCSVEVKIEQSQEPPQSLDGYSKEEILTLPISSLGFSLRLQHILRTARISQLSQLHGYDYRDLLRIPGIGKKFADEIEKLLIKYE